MNNGTIPEGPIVESIAGWPLDKIRQKRDEGCITTHMVIMALMIKRARFCENGGIAKVGRGRLVDYLCGASLDEYVRLTEENRIRRAMVHHPRSAIN